jgi:hypothetical protein
MKKSLHKVKLSRETLRQLEASSLGEAAGDGTLTFRICPGSNYYTCNPSCNYCPTTSRPTCNC